MSDGKKKSKKGVTMNLTDFLSDGNSVGNWGDDIELPTGPQSDSRSYGDNVFGSSSNRYDNNDRYDKYEKYDKYDKYNNNNNDHYGGGYERNNDRYNNDRNNNDRYGNNNRYGNNDRYNNRNNNDRYYGGRQGNQNHDMYGGQDQRRHYQNDRYGGNNNRYDNRERHDRFDNREREPRQRPSRPIPENPPYTAYFGNLPEDTTEESLRSVIAPLKVKSIRLITHDDGRLKGFGYVEFEDRADLENAIRGEEVMYKGRILRIDVAEQKEKPEKPSDNSNWRARSDNKNGFSVFGNRNNNNNNNQYNNNRQETTNWRVRNNDNAPSQGRKPFGNHRADEPISSPTPAPAAPPKKKINPFGEAKPVDTAEIERKVEEKMIKADEEILKKDKENEEKKEGETEEPKDVGEIQAPVQAPRERPMSQQKTRSSYYNNNRNNRPSEENSWRRSTNSAPPFKSTGVFQRNNNRGRYQQPRNNYNQMRKEEENRNVVEIKNTYQVLQDE